MFYSERRHDKYNMEHVGITEDMKEKIIEKQGAHDYVFCPECGAKVIHESGCVVCPSCGWGLCG